MEIIEKERFIATFPSINHFTNKEIKEKYSDCEWLIEEKVDGSQLSFCLNEDNKITFFNKILLNLTHENQC